MVFTRKLSQEFEYGRQDTPIYDFLNRSPRDDVERVRQLIEDWVSLVPETERSRLIRTLRSRDDNEFHAAFFEVYCNKLLIDNNYSVEYHAKTPNGRSVDFQVSDDALVFALEATITVESVDWQKRAQIENKVLDYIDQYAFVPGFRYEIQILQAESDIPGLKDLARQIRSWTQSFDRARVRSLFETHGFHEAPTRNFSKDDWEIQVSLLPRPTQETEIPAFAKSIGIGPMKITELKHNVMLLNSLKRKAQHYGRLELPFVIAINTVFDFRMNDNIDILQALLGTEAMVFNPTTGNHKPTREPDGLWIGPSGPRNRHVSAVLLCNNISPWLVAREIPTLYINPWADYPLPESSLPVNTYKWDKTTGQPVESSGSHPSKTFSLPENWPDN